MRSKAEFLGHAIHPMLIGFPIALLSLTPVFDVVHFVTRDHNWARFAFWLLTSGLVGGVVAAVPGVIDMLAIPHGTRARRVATTHFVVNLSAIAFYVTSFVLRVIEGTAVGSIAPFALGVVGFAVMMVGGWLGGELVERLTVSVYEDANVDAPSSLDAEKLMRRAEARGSQRRPGDRSPWIPT